MSDETSATQYVMGTMYDAADRFTDLVGEIVNDPEQEFTDDDFTDHPFESAQKALYDACRTARKTRIANYDADLVDAIYAIETAIDRTEQALDVCPGCYNLTLEREVMNELQTARERAYGYVVTHADPDSVASEPAMILALTYRPGSATEAEAMEQLGQQSEYQREGT